MQPSRLLGHGHTNFDVSVSDRLYYEHSALCLVWSVCLCRIRVFDLAGNECLQCQAKKCFDMSKLIKNETITHGPKRLLGDASFVYWRLYSYIIIHLFLKKYFWILWALFFQFKRMARSKHWIFTFRFEMSKLFIDEKWIIFRVLCKCFEFIFGIERKLQTQQKFVRARDKGKLPAEWRSQVFSINLRAFNHLTSQMPLKAVFF